MVPAPLLIRPAESANLGPCSESPSHGPKQVSATLPHKGLRRPLPKEGVLIPDDLLDLFGVASAGNNSLPDIFMIMTLVPLGIVLAAPTVVLFDLAREYLIGPT